MGQESLELPAILLASPIEAERELVRRINNNITELNTQLSSSVPLIEVNPLRTSGYQATDDLLDAVDDRLSQLATAASISFTATPRSNLRNDFPDIAQQIFATHEATMSSLYASEGGGGGADDALLASIDFAAGDGQVSGTSYSLSALFTQGAYDNGDISPSDGWFAATDQYGMFGAPLAPVLARAAGFIAVIIAEDAGVGTTIQLTLANSSFSKYIGVTCSNGLDALNISTAERSNAVHVENNSPHLVKFAAKVTPTTLSALCTGGVLDSMSPTGTEIDTWDASQSFLENGGSSCWKIQSISFYGPDADMTSLVAI